jgi:uncharacterized phage-associated protein
MIQNLFNEKKAAQAAAYFLFRAGAQLTVLKLTKLLYLAERSSFERYGAPMIGDRLVSMPHGPVLSITYNHMSGELESVVGGWDSWIADRAEHNLDLRDRAALKSPEDDLQELSDADLAVLADVWQHFGHMTASGLRNWTHKNCPEWKDPEGSMIPMTPQDLFAALNFTPEQTQEALARLRAESTVTAAFASVKG